jgi:hypothetical protein
MMLSQPSSQSPQLDEHDADEVRFQVQKKSPWSAAVGGFDVHAGVTIRAGDRAGLEQLCRYAAPTPVALGRLSMLADRRVAYRLRKPRNNGATHLVMSPVELLAKIASVVPPPRQPLLRLSGVLGPRSSWRASVVPGGARVARHAHTDSGVAKTGGVDDKTRLAHPGDAGPGVPRDGWRDGQIGPFSSYAPGRGARFRRPKSLTRRTIPSIPGRREPVERPQRALLVASSTSSGKSPMSKHWSVLVTLLLIACSTSGCAAGPYRFRGSWEPPPRPMLIALDRATEGRAVVPLDDGDIVVAGDMQLPDREPNFVLRLSPDGRARWALRYHACESELAIAEGARGSVWLALRGLLAVGEDRRAVAPSDPYEVCHTGTPLTSFLHVDRDGRVVTRVDLEQGMMSPALFALPDGGVLGIGNSPWRRGVQFIALDEGGRVAWRRWDGTAILTLRPARSGGHIVMVHGPPEIVTSTAPSDCVIEAVDLHGERLWSRHLDTGPSGCRVVSGMQAAQSGLVLQIGNDHVGVNTATGAQRWARPVPPQLDGISAWGPPWFLRREEVLWGDRLSSWPGRLSPCGAAKGECTELVAIDTETGALRPFTRLIGDTVRLDHGKSVFSSVQTKSVVIAASAVWLVGTYGGRLNLGEISIQTEARVLPTCQVDDTECSAPAGDYSVVTSWSAFVARIPINRPP